jgi:hypothetical protein
MVELMKLRQAARLIGVSPGRLYRAIAAGRLAAAPGGGPGKATLVSLEALQAFCRSEGLPPPRATAGRERAAHSERSINPDAAALAQRTLENLMGQYLARIMERQNDYFEAFLREELSHLVDRVLERVADQLSERLAARFSTVVERSEPAEPTERSETILSLPEPRPMPTPAGQRAVLLQRLQAMRAEGLSRQAMADRLNAEGVPTLSGKGRWHRGSIGKLFAQADA